MAKPKSNDALAVKHALLGKPQRFTKVNKGKNRLLIGTLIVAGNGAGEVSYAKGKAQELAAAKDKAIKSATRRLIKVPLYQNRTFHHDVMGKYGAGKVVMKKAQPGTGVIASDSIKPIFSLLGVTDIVVKSLGSSNPYTLVRAVFDGLRQLQAPRTIAERRGKKVSELSGHNSIQA